MTHQIRTDDVVRLGRLSLDFGRIDRITYHQDGCTPESDTDHTVMLGIVACAFAARYLPKLDLGLVAQFALVHDFVEVFAGDTPTLREYDAAEKKQREKLALEELIRQTVDLPWVGLLIEQYESRSSDEARYVKAMDKLLPKITHILNDCRTFIEQGISLDELQDRYRRQFYEIGAYLPTVGFEPLWELRWELVKMVINRYSERLAGEKP